MLKIKNMSVEVEGKRVLSEINLEVKKGERLALLGPNGSGKTSLLMAIIGFSDYKIVQGEIIFRDRRIDNLSIDERACLGIGVMFQRPPTIKGIKIRQMVDLIKQNDFDINKEAEELKLKEFLNRDINLGFSGGELKRSELFQLLACSPQLSLFDEPESGVDLENIALVGKTINRILDKDRDNAALIITHTGYIFNYVESDVSCVLVNGRIHCVGNPKKILQAVKERGYKWCATCQGERLSQMKSRC
ncbi:MAG: ABC transporter ATP-binding protein [Candidatus Aminicenantes bacterium]|nr:MAG: ABC transporter ATP-binding protein [Candidatus Aminicenantes bacterium]